MSHDWLLELRARTAICEKLSTGLTSLEHAGTCAKQLDNSRQEWPGAEGAVLRRPCFDLLPNGSLQKDEPYTCMHAVHTLTTGGSAVQRRLCLCAPFSVLNEQPCTASACVPVLRAQ